jgi:hypothetical protein
MSNIGLIIISVIFILSSLSEKIEFIVYNEEVLLALCFVLFVFFIYGYLNESVYNDFQKKIEGLEDQLFNVISEKFNTTLVHFNELFLLKGLEFKLSTIESLLYSRISSHFTLYRGQILKDKASSLVSISLFEILRSGSKITEKLQKKVVKTIFISNILDINYSSSKFSLTLQPYDSYGVTTFFNKLSAIKSDLL